MVAIQVQRARAHPQLEVGQTWDLGY